MQNLEVPSKITAKKTNKVVFEKMETEAPSGYVFVASHKSVSVFVPKFTVGTETESKYFDGVCFKDIGSLGVKFEIRKEFYGFNLNSFGTRALADVTVFRYKTSKKVFLLVVKKVEEYRSLCMYPRMDYCVDPMTMIPVKIKYPRV